MQQLVNWEYYSSLHSIIAKEEFERAEALAEKEIKLVVGWPRWEAIDPDAFYMEQLKDCICNVMDRMEEDKRSGRGKGISSASNDGYSESYSVQTETQLKAELQASIRRWLSGTGLAGAY